MRRTSRGPGRNPSSALALRLTAALSLVAVFGCAGSPRPLPRSEVKQPASCQCTLMVSGALFSPEVCAVYAVTPGVPCGPNTPCPDEYSISLKDPAPTHVREVILVNFRGLQNGTRLARPAPGQRDFDGTLIESGNKASNLVHGEVTLEQVVGTDSLNVTFDLVFASDIGVRGTAVLPVRRVIAP